MKLISLILSLILRTLIPSSSAQFYLDEFSDVNQANFEPDPYQDSQYQHEKSLKDHYATRAPFYKATVQTMDVQDAKRGVYYGQITLDDHVIPVYVIKPKKQKVEDYYYDEVKTPLMEHKPDVEKKYFYPGYKKHLQKLMQKIDAVKNLARTKIATGASKLFGAATTSFVDEGQKFNGKLHILDQTKDLSSFEVLHEDIEGKNLDPRKAQDFFSKDTGKGGAKIFKDKDLKSHIDDGGLKNIPLNGLCDKGFKKDALGVCRFVWN